MASVTGIAKKAKQPKGGYVKLSSFVEEQRSDNLPFAGEYSVPASIVGIAVDYLSRVALGTGVNEAFRVSIAGAMSLGSKEYERAEKLAEQIKKVKAEDLLSPDCITAACKLSGYDAAARAGEDAYKDVDGIIPDQSTIQDIKTLVERTVAFFKDNGPVVATGMTFEGGYSGDFDAGDADFLTQDTLWDLKTSKDEPSTQDTLQLAIYYLASIHSPKEEFKSIENIGFFNPRLNKSWKVAVLDLDDLVLDDISTKLLGYAAPESRRVVLKEGKGTTVYAVIDWCRETATSERDKGDKFERASRYFLKNDPLYAAKFEEVWMWRDAPTNNGQDIGIDLVAKDTEDGSYWAIQCKCWGDNTRLTYDEVSTFFGATGNSGTYRHNMLISTTEYYTPNLDKVTSEWGTVRLFPSDMDQADIDWQPFLDGKEVGTREIHEALPHQRLAIDDCKKGFEEHNRGKLIMACGTGKTLTSLRLSEEMLEPGSLVLFLAPSISLVGQTMRAWANQAKAPMRCAVVCSDAKASDAGVDMWESSLKDLPYPATTDAQELFKQMGGRENKEGFNVIFSTYQSIQVVADAQKLGLDPFDLVICDEAHRTTGVSDVGESKQDQSEFVKVHDNGILSAKKRLYMTATPRIYGEVAKKKAKAEDYEVSSMDDESKFGPEFHRLTFGQAVDQDLLTDYRVIALTVSEDMVSEIYQQAMDADSEFKIPDAAKIIGCWKGLADQGSEDGHPLRNAVAFCSTIAESKRMQEYFGKVVDRYIAEEEANGKDLPGLRCEIDHVDGTMDSSERKQRLRWLEAGEGSEENPVCHILTNARCLSEGIDVPNLDAVMFLQPKKSQIEVTQAVGRVMRKFEGKKYGYIILPIVVPAGMTAEQALDDNEPYQVVWQILKALRSHDERLEATINALPYDKPDTKDVVRVIDMMREMAKKEQEDKPQQLRMYFTDHELQEAVNAMIVRKCGTKVYWEDWAKDIAQIARRHIERITELVSGDGAARKPFEKFLKGLRDSLNDGISEAEAIDMLAQHMITLPVFEALFRGANFASSNPVSVAMETMIEALRKYDLETEQEKRELAELYRSVEIRAESVHTDAGRQRIIKELYEKFFSQAFRATSEKMGIVYTPNQVVDYILHATDRLLEKEFGQHLCDEGVHVLDPFTGTGTFIVDLINDEKLMPVEKLPFKYANELHCNEILLLAYYIATINIEHAYHSRVEGDYVPFPGAVLTDTFQMYEIGDPLDLEVFVDNSERILRQMESPINVIIGNPPYSAGQQNANDNNANESYPTLDGKIAQTYASKTSATLKTALYDSYIRAFRWASDRIGKRGVISFVSNGGWIDGQSTNGFRKCLVEEFSSIYVFNLRGNQRTQGEQSRKEGGKIFGSGSRAPIAITMLVKNPDAAEQGTIYYHDIGDYLDRDTKLAIVGSSLDQEPFEWDTITPDKHGDWLNQRDDSFDDFAPLGLENRPQKTPNGIFSLYSLGVSTNRDSWLYGFSRHAVAKNVSSLIDCYSEESERYQKEGQGSSPDSFMNFDTTQIAWSSTLLRHAASGDKALFDKGNILKATYRPFCKQWLYFDQILIDRQGQADSMFPPGKPNLAITITNGSSPLPLVVDGVPNLHTNGDSRCFPLYWYERKENLGGLFEVSGSDDFVQHDAITDEALELFRSVYSRAFPGRYKKDGGEELTKEDIFFYIYGILHSKEYRERFASNLKKDLPRMPLARDFASFSHAGRKLSDLHLGYETVEPYPLTVRGDVDNPGKVSKMKWGKKRDPETGKKVDDVTTLIYSENLTFSGIPEAANDYKVNGRSPLEWMIDRYQVKTDKASGIVNDPNEYSDDPTYISGLIPRLVTVSMATLDLVNSLPELNELSQPNNWPIAWKMSSEG